MRINEIAAILTYENPDHIKAAFDLHRIDVRRTLYKLKEKKYSYERLIGQLQRSKSKETDLINDGIKLLTAKMNDYNDAISSILRVFKIEQSADNRPRVRSVAQIQRFLRETETQR